MRGKATRRQEVVAARQGDSRDEWLVALWNVWQTGSEDSPRTWEASRIYARVNTPDGDPKGIALAHKIADLVRAEVFGLFPAYNARGERVLVTVPESDTEGRESC